MDNYLYDFSINSQEKAYNINIFRETKVVRNIVSNILFSLTFENNINCRIPCISRAGKINSARYTKLASLGHENIAFSF